MHYLILLLSRIKLHLKIRFYNEHNVARFYRKEFGVSIGKNCRIIGKRLDMFGSEPYLINIGSNVTISEDVKFITHDGGVGIFRREYGDINIFGMIQVKDNCFIGVNSIILNNVVIGPNSVIGAGSVVTKDVPSNTVVGGVPARTLMHVDQYKKKALKKGIILDKNCSYNSKKQIIMSEVINSYDNL